GVVVRAEVAVAEVIVVRADDDDLARFARDVTDDVRGLRERLLVAGAVAGGLKPEAREALRDERARREGAGGARGAAAERRRGEVGEPLAESVFAVGLRVVEAARLRLGNRGVGRGGGRRLRVRFVGRGRGRSAGGEQEEGGARHVSKGRAKSAKVSTQDLGA